MARLKGKKRVLVERSLGSGGKHYLIIKNRDKAISIKPRNITVNIKDIVLNLPEMALSASTAYSSDSLMVVIAALVNLARAIGKSFTCEIKKEHALVLIGLWEGTKCKDNKYFIPVEDGFGLVNRCFESNGEKTISMRRYQRILDELEKLRCIEILDNNIYLTESIAYGGRRFGAKRNLVRVIPYV